MCHSPAIEDEDHDDYGELEEEHKECVYVPRSRRESNYYDMLWCELNPTEDELVGGQVAVEFFLTTGLDIGLLKKIWALSSPDDKMDINQFYAALRFIAMYQSGERELTAGES
jgi:hypothetical protein